jgi:hypothetical protein
LKPDARIRSKSGILGPTIELLRLPEVERLIAIFLALVSFYYAYRWAGHWILERAMRSAPHDGMTGLGTAVMGLMVGVPTAIFVYFLSFNIMRTWERHYTQKLVQMEQMAD